MTDSWPAAAILARMACRATWQPTSDRTSDREPNGDEAIFEVPFRP